MILSADIGDRFCKQCAAGRCGTYVGFHPTPQQGHCPCTHLAEVVGWFYIQCAAETRIYRSGFDKEQPECSKTIAARPPHGLAVFHRRPDAVHPGKTKKDGEKIHFLGRPFLRFHCARGVCCVCSFRFCPLANRFLGWFRFLPSFHLSGGKHLFTNGTTSPTGCREELPAVGYRGRAVPCFGPTFTARTHTRRQCPAPPKCR